MTTDTLGIGEPPVLNGTTGEVITTTVDGKEARVDTTTPPEQPRLIDVSLESLVHDFTKLWDQREEKRAELKTVSKGLRNEVQALSDRITPIVAELKRRDVEVTEELQPSMFDGIQAAAQEPIDDFDPINQGDEDEPGDDAG